MSKITAKECQNVEYKRGWKDEVTQGQVPVTQKHNSTRKKTLYKYGKRYRE